MSQTTVAYIRVSTEAQNEGNGPEQQKLAILAWAKTKDVQIDEWVLETETGTIAEREQIQLLLARAQCGEIGRLVLDRINRFARKASVSLTLKDAFNEAGVEVVFAQQHISNDPHGKFMFTVLSGLAELDRSEWLGRMQQCKLAAVTTRGSFRGGQVPLGYKKGFRGQLEIDEASAAMVREVFRLRDKGHTLLAIAASLEMSGYVTSTGKRYDAKQISQILKREAAYRGTAVFGNVQSAVKPLHPAILEHRPMHVERHEPHSTSR